VIHKAEPLAPQPRVAHPSMMRTDAARLITRAGWCEFILSVSGNGMTALAALGLDEAVRAVGCRTAVAGYQNPAGRWLMRLPDAGSDPRAITTIWGLHRQRLHGVLREAAEKAGDIQLVTDAEVTGVQPGGHPRR
jgi:2-polyprenyl-6-methoxyphenol hydroxylase-like FAD-dependent oxidoreductase